MKNALDSCTKDPFIIEGSLLVKYDGGEDAPGIPEGITAIGKEAFYGVKLHSIVIPEGITVIGEYAFAHTKLEEVHIPATVTAIGEGAFATKSIRAITVSEDNPCFTGKEGILFDKTLQTLMIYPRGKGGAQYTIPLCLRVIGNSAFSDTQVSSVSLPRGLGLIGNYAFAYTNLTSVSIPSSVSQIGTHAFAFCKQLVQVELFRLTKVHRDAFIASPVRLRYRN
ncbi:MAG: leucine-rich repeat domain-containing protein [Treponema sp.]|nr:leucine-rich repeat domain-containing protein [Treponema sp.]